jgi:abortive infection bacteriophage resistance protein
LRPSRIHREGLFDVVRQAARSCRRADLLLKGRGLVCADEALVRRWLVTVGYYRLSAYWLPYELPPSEGQTRSKTFPPDTAFESIVDIYTFDRQLRLLVMEASERIEIALRASWTHRLSLASGPHAHMDPSLFVPSC